MTQPTPGAALRALIEKRNAYLVELNGGPDGHIEELKLAKSRLITAACIFVSALPPEGRHPEDRIARIVQRVAELPDRTSPDDWPVAMLVTGDELQTILREELAEGRQEPEDQG